MKLLKVYIAAALIVGNCLFAVETGQEKNCRRARYLLELAEMEERVNYPEREKLYRETIKLCPNLPIAYNNLGHVLEKTGRFDEAIFYYKKAAALAPGEPIPYFGLGDVCFKTKNYGEAKEWYKKGLKVADDGTAELRLLIIGDLQKDGAVSAKTIADVMGYDAENPMYTIFTFDTLHITAKKEFTKGSCRQLDEIGKAIGMLIRRRGGENKTRAIGVVKDGQSVRPLVFTIRPHTDVPGSEEHNRELSLKWANRISQYLQTHGKIPAKFLKVEPAGNSNPLCFGDSPACRSVNQRVEIFIDYRTPLNLSDRHHIH